MKSEPSVTFSDQVQVNSFQSDKPRVSNGLMDLRSQAYDFLQNVYASQRTRASYIEIEEEITDLKPVETQHQPVEPVRIKSASSWQRRKFLSSTLKKSNTSTLKEAIAKPVKLIHQTEPLKPKRPSESLLSRTVIPPRMKKAKSLVRRQKSAYDSVLSTSFRRKTTLLPVSIENKYSWLKRLLLAAKN